MFFGIPVFVVMAMNFCFFVSSAHMICTSKMSPSHKSSKTNSNTKLFARLSLLMGLTWIVGFIADYVDLDAVWYIYVVLNAFQVSVIYTIQVDSRGMINNLGSDRMIFVMVGVAFLTLLGRRVLGYVHIRKGPNKVGFVGILQPFRDAITLFTREQYFPLVSNYLIYYFSPIFGGFPFSIGLVITSLFEWFYLF